MASPLKLLAKAQLEYTDHIIVGCVALTAILAVGIPSIQLETDFQGSLPDSLDPIETQDKIQANFGNTDAIIILFQTSDNPVQNSTVTDIRDPRVIRTMNFLESEFENEPLVASTNSMASLFEQNPESKQDVKQVLAQTDASFTNRDYTAATMFIQMNEEADEENIREATQIINQNIDEAPKYPGVDLQITGTPIMRSTLSDILVTDSTRIIALASGLILLLLTGVRGLFYGPATFTPLFLGLIWTLGAMGLLGIPLTIATIALGSMLLGLGVEYGSFITERIVEETEQKGIEEGIMKSMPNTGRAVLGSSTTDLMGFLALLLASISFIRDLGLTLALGEFLTLTAALVLTPALIIKYKRFNGDTE